MDDSDINKEFSRNPTLDDLVELCKHLNEINAEYVVIGGFALIHYGFIRGTADIDLLVNNSEENISKIRKALLYLPDKAAKELSLTDIKEYHVVRIADEIVIDLLEKACGVSFEDAKKHIVYETIKNIPIPYLDVELLIQTKQSIRPKDVIDRQYLEQLLNSLKKKS